MEILILLVVLAIASLRIVTEKERGVVVILGKPKWVVESGVAFVPFPIAQLIRYPKGMIELKMRDVPIATKSGRSAFNAQDSQRYSSAQVSAEVSFRFYYPRDPKRLMRTVAVLPHPSKNQSLNGTIDNETKNLFEEAVMDCVRSVGSNVTWTDLSRDHRLFGGMITASFVDNDAKERENQWKRQGNPLRGFPFRKPHFRLVR